MASGRFLIVAALALALPGAALAQQSPAASQVTVTVDTSRPGPVIDRHIYGQFAEHLGHGIYDGIWVGENSKIPNIHGYRTDVVNALKAIKVPVVRWPGGCFGDLYDWRDGIGPRAKRPVRINVHWGGVTEDNSFGTNEFLNFVELIGADAYVSGNVGSMTPLDMAQWVEYMTSDENASLANERRRNGRAKPWTIKYFGIGNELWGCGGNMNAQYASDVSKRYATFVTAPPGMQMTKVISGPNGSNPNAAEDTDTMMTNIPNMQMLSIHRYTFPRARDPNAPPGAPYDRGNATGFPESDWAVTLAKAETMEPMLSKLSAVMDRHDPEKHIPIALDEWGAWYNQEPGSHPGFLYQQNSLRDAEVAALTLNIFHRHTDRVKMANIAQMVNVLQAMILTDHEKFLRTPTYWVYFLYVPFQGATPYAASVSGPNYTFENYSIAQVDASAARGTDGKLYLSLVNTDPHKPAHVTTNLSGSATGHILTGPAMDTHNTFDAPNTVMPAAYSGHSEGGKLVFDLPPRAVAVVRIQ
ncbi:MAG TPA: alpha-L-arabinofuranosidase C-terminal domain-containing protein [Rhizomicrobium sp.]|jgi:alpha-N-arabinofuranosidase|nr:alpha-L-arabinofuranosidase C-terminal domain-containing protein [Rhizomicrobium sp.]